MSETAATTEPEPQPEPTKTKTTRAPRVTRKTPAPVLAGPAAVRHADGRVMVVCRKHDAERIAANKALRAEDKPTTPAPRLDEEHVLPKAPRAATVEK